MVIVGIILAMVKHFNLHNRQIHIFLGYLFVASAIWLVFMFEFRLDDSFITYQYARNLAQGLGLVYNAGENVLSTTAPLYAMLLAALSTFIHDFHTLGSLITVGSIGTGGWLIFRLLKGHLHSAICIWAGLLYVTSSIFWLAVGMETTLWIALVLAAVQLGQSRRWGTAGFIVGIATLVRADAVIPGMMLGILLIISSVNRIGTTRVWWDDLFRFMFAGSVPLLGFFAWAWLTYGSPFPATLGAKSAQAVLGISGLGLDVHMWDGLGLIFRSLMRQSPLYIVLVLITLFGLAGPLNNSSRFIVVWGLLHLLGYIVLKVAPYRWYYAPLMPGIIILGALGLSFLQNRIQQRGFRYSAQLIGMIAMFPLIASFTSLIKINSYIHQGGPADTMLPIVDWNAYREIGEWLNSDAPVDATVGVAEVGQVGFYSRRWMTDYLGLLQPDVAEAMRRGDLYSWLVGYAPNYLVFQRFRGAGLVLYNLYIQDDPWFSALYKPVVEFDDPRYVSGPVTIFERPSFLRPMNSEVVQFDFGNLRLVGFSSDGSEIPASGAPVRVRLDWEVRGAIPPKLHIAVKGLDIASINPGFDGDYQTTYWSGHFSTWHGFVVPAAEAGEYELLVSVGQANGPYEDRVVGVLSITND